jgi:aryl-alcohol dehydrogenase-like predicted oxidoreductase
VRLHAYIRSATTRDDRLAHDTVRTLAQMFDSGKRREVGASVKPQRVVPLSMVAASEAKHKSHDVHLSSRGSAATRNPPGTAAPSLTGSEPGERAGFH